MYTMVLSISHRISGVFQSIGMLLLVYWLVAAASGGGAYATAAKVFGNPLVKLAIAGWIVAFWFHLFAGVRHLFWDAGYGFEKATARRSARLVLVMASLASLFTLALAWRHLGGGA
jgi:succinate dehydrogenase / fumarate reductase cytochrome b subunit